MDKVSGEGEQGGGCLRTGKQAGCLHRAEQPDSLPPSTAAVWPAALLLLPQGSQAGRSRHAGGPLHPLVLRQGRQALELCPLLPRLQLRQEQHPAGGKLSCGHEAAEPLTAEPRPAPGAGRLQGLQPQQTGGNVSLCPVQRLPIQLETSYHSTTAHLWLW